MGRKNWVLVVRYRLVICKASGYCVPMTDKKNSFNKQPNLNLISIYTNTLKLLKQTSIFT